MKEYQKNVLFLIQMQLKLILRFKIIINFLHLLIKKNAQILIYLQYIQ